MNKFHKFSLALVLSLLTAMAALANETTTVEQVNDGVKLDTDVDYVITGATPFTTAGSVDITNTEHAVLIIKNLKPSAVIKGWLSHVYINGQAAKNGTNCQVKMYAQGAIIMPYGKDFKPLTVYSERNFGGTSVNSFGLENTGGYMNTLSDEKLNNKIRSFKLKRGYMVTFATGKAGWGYSRCFIADKADLEIASLPNVLDHRISSYRVFQWYDAQKKGVASDTRANYVGQVNASWCYSWGLGENLLPDIECVPNHIYEDWPSSSACGGVTYSCHMKTNNEPGNSADDHPQDVATVLNNWQNLMRTGMRLCSESSHDGSWGHLRAFIDSIDARGWRCDLLDLHCYWNEGAFNNLASYYTNYGNRPIWISEWVWGASWNASNWSNGGIFAQAPDGKDSYSEANQKLNYEHVKSILDVLNKNTYIERYAYWNSEADASKIYKDANMSMLGKYYAEMESGMAYNSKYEKVPTNPRQYSPSMLKASYDKNTKKVKLSWHEYNGEYNQSMTVQVKKPGSSVWSVAVTPELQEGEADYDIEVDGLDGYKYRVVVVDLNNKTRYTNEATALNDQLEEGDGISVGEETLYMGGNMLLNGDFNFGLLDWANGEGKPLAAPYYEVVPMGGFDGGAYLQAYGGNDSKTSEQSIRREVSLQKGAYYYVQLAGCNTGSNQKITTTTTAIVELNSKVTMPDVSQWSKQGTSFLVDNDTILLMQLRSLGGKAQFDKAIVARLFTSQDDAKADALVWAKKRAELFKQYKSDVPQVAEYIDEVVAGAKSAADIDDAIAKALEAISLIPTIHAFEKNLAMAKRLGAEGYADIEKAYNTTYSYFLPENYLALGKAISEFEDKAFPYVLNTDDVTNSTFASGSTGWVVKAGTYTAGDQRTATQAGKSCWNAWWSTPSEGGSETTMAIKQELSKLPHGLYAVECKATTQHYCVTDQHLFASLNGESVTSLPMTYGVLDLPSVADADKWEQLVTPYLYISDDDTLTIGFTGSKQGAIDKTWHSYGSPNNTGDNREGWWCATDFSLRSIPAYRTQVGTSHWGSVCLPYMISVPENVTLYKLAGITADSLYICLEPADAIEVGAPYIYKCNNDEAFFFESGTKISVPKTNVNGLRGVFTSSSKYPVGSLVLENGIWNYIPDTDSRYAIAPNTGYIQKVENLAVLDSWAGEKLPTQGLAKEDPTGISNINAIAGQKQRIYNVKGQLLQGESNGIVITKGKKAIKK